METSVLVTLVSLLLANGLNGLKEAGYKDEEVDKIMDIYKAGAMEAMEQLEQGWAKMEAESKSAE